MKFRLKNIFEHSLNFANRQFVRIQWGYAKVAVFVGIINSVSLMVTALSVSGLVAFTWVTLLLLIVSALFTILLMIYIMAKFGVLQNETKQTFDERMSNLWKLQTEYQAVLIAYNLQPTEELKKRKEQLELKLFGKGNNNSQ